MRSVYLDQNKYIELARVYYGRDMSGQLRDALDMALGAADRGLAAFPLSAGHYMETATRGDDASRQRLASFMVRLSDLHTIAGQPELVPCEIDRACQRYFGRPSAPRTHPVFGIGAGHAFGHPEEVRYRLPDELPLDEPARTILERKIQRVMEETLLGARSKDPAVHAKLRQFSQNYVAGERAKIANFQDHKATGSLRDRALLAIEVLDLREEIALAFARAGIDMEEFYNLGLEGITEFMEQVSTRHVDHELSKLRHQDANLPRKSGDLTDIAELSVATVYCDVVVTERFWATLIRRAGLDVKYGTIVLSDLRKLPTALVSLR